MVWDVPFLDLEGLAESWTAESFFEDEWIA
jgi:hypothetical protein